MMNKKHLGAIVLLFSLTTVAGCASESAETTLPDEALNAEYGKPLMAEVDVAGKDDSVKGVVGLPLSVDEGPMVVWDVENQWEELDTPNAHKAGLAWPENSGLDWNEKYAAWVGSLEQTEGQNASLTFLMTTPLSTAPVFV